MAGDYAEWSAAEQFYSTWYQMESAYQMTMAQQPPDVILAFRILRQMYDRVACFLADSTVKGMDERMRQLQELLYDLDLSSYAWVPAVKARVQERRHKAISLLSDAQRTLYKAMNDKRMLIPMSKQTTPGYAKLGPGGVMRS